MEDFISNSERFFKYLQYSFMIEPESGRICQDNWINYSLPPDVFRDLLKHFDLVYPYNWEIEIIKIRSIFFKEELVFKDCLRVIENLKERYTYGNPAFFTEQFENIKSVHLKVEKNINSNDLDKRVEEYVTHVIQKRDEIIESLINSIKHQDLDTNQEKPKKPFRDKETENTNLLTHTQINIIEKLINKGHKDVHIYRFLKDEVQFINISESEFVRFLNEHHERNYKTTKRFTALSSITIPIELRSYFDEINP